MEDLLQTWCWSAAGCGLRGGLCCPSELNVSPIRTRPFLAISGVNDGLGPPLAASTFFLRFFIYIKMCNNSLLIIEHVYIYISTAATHFIRSPGTSLCVGIIWKFMKIEKEVLLVGCGRAGGGGPQRKMWLSVPRWSKTALHTYDKLPPQRHLWNGFALVFLLFCSFYWSSVSGPLSESADLDLIYKVQVSN